MAELVYAEIVGVGRNKWYDLEAKQREWVLRLPFVRRISGTRIYFQADYQKEEISAELEEELRRCIGDCQVTYHTDNELAANRLAQRLAEPKAFEKLSFGSDVAEHDDALLNYFISTKAFHRVRERQKSVVIGPKGSGKSAILRALTFRTEGGFHIVITPEVFATSMLRQFVEDSSGVWDEEESFVSTWIFTILVEVFKRICETPRGIPDKALKRVRQFLRDNSNYQEMDLFTRFIGYLKRIQSIKVGDYELTVKTRMLQDMYALAQLYELIPGLRAGLKEDIHILIDELDQGWDNSLHSNRFLASLLQAAIRIQRLGMRVHVVVFIRSEIFDLVKYQLDQLDKLRSSIEVLKWKPEELGAMILKRIDYCLGNQIGSADYSLLEQIFREPCRGMSGFEYIVSRTTRRPREVLQFVRQAHSIAVESRRKQITKDSIMKAEEEFSAWKLEHLCSEYKYIFPSLQDILWTFRGYGPVLSADDATQLIQIYLESVDYEKLPTWVKLQPKEILQILYTIDFIGVRRLRTDKLPGGILGAYEFGYESPSANVKAAYSFIVHPAFWSVLEISPA